MSIHSFYPQYSERALAWLARELKEVSTEPLEGALSVFQEGKSQKKFAAGLKDRKSYEYVVYQRLRKIHATNYGKEGWKKAIITAGFTAPITLPLYFVSRACHKLVVGSREPLLTLRGANRHLGKQMSVSYWNIGREPLNHLAKRVRALKSSVFLLRGDFQRDPPKLFTKAGFDVVCSSQFCILSRYKIVNVKLEEETLSAVIQVADKRFACVVVADTSHKVKPKFLDFKIRDIVVAGRFKSYKSTQVLATLNPASFTYRNFVEVVAYKAFGIAKLFFVKRESFAVVTRLILQKKKKDAIQYLYSLNGDSEEIEVVVRAVRTAIEDVRKNIYRDSELNTQFELRTHKNGIFCKSPSPSDKVILGEYGPITEGSVVTAVLKKKKAV